MTDYTQTSSYTVATGTASSNPFVTHFDTRNPGPYDTQYPLQKRWVNTNNASEFILTGFDSTSGSPLADWLLLSSGSSTTETLTGNDGINVGPDGTGNINVVGDGSTILTSGNAGTNTLTISVSEDVTTLYTTDAGNVTPSGGQINVFGANGISTAGAGNTITIANSDSVATVYTANDATTATPSLGNLNVFGDGTLISTTAAGNTVTINAGGGIATIYHTDDNNSATPSAGILNVAGGSGITTSSTGNTVTISASSAIFEKINVQQFTTSGTYTPTAGMAFCIVQIVGGGGGGGGATGPGAGNISIASGGGAATYCQSLFNAATIGVSQAITIGAGGAGGAAGTNNGNPGGTTTFGALMTATGGTAGISTVNSNNQVFAALSDISASTVGSVGQLILAGGPGGGALGATQRAWGGRGGRSYFGGEGAGGTLLGSYNATGYGSGGGAPELESGYSNTAGGNGASGFVYITEFIGG